MRTKKISPYIFPGLRTKQTGTFQRTPISNLTTDMVLYAVGNRTGISLDAMRLITRARQISDARALLFYLSYKHIHKSTYHGLMAAYSIKRDRTSCIAMIRKVTDMINTYPDYAQMVEKLEANLYELSHYALAA